MSDLLALQREAEAEGFTLCAGALVFNDKGQVFCQRRSMTRKLFPGCWDILGGHVDPGETLEECLRREVFEESGWRVTHIGALAYQHEWDEERPDGIIRVREFDFITGVEGDLERPKLEEGKVDAYGWFDLSNAERLKENWSPGEPSIHDMVLAALKMQED
ncbi:NUDIX hydrolase [Tepidicaulis sp. LMO-SS28]|uniref:NUDIX hydrolase n=1 Tax=Tepidicaulis sp. LMO-SS28 TaxID=3447455 RepID=UPI003EE30807